MKTRQITMLPDSQALFSPAGRPMGNISLLCPGIRAASCFFDFKAQKW
jgi:hypothetical protein